MWESFLYHYGATLEVNGMVGYLCLERLSSYDHDARAMQKYVADALKIHENKRYVMGAFFEKYYLAFFNLSTVIVCFDNCLHCFDYCIAIIGCWLYFVSKTTMLVFLTHCKQKKRK
ncbi:hypothetical protein RND81_02G132400 [Saponaria officinalis]|uniref:Uncharacterized protein n=1 Tax=Saponaria officinalis TaxID=3572 RepID=A0AAW1MU55_SAPOF